jgi:RNA 2',3'-cyclic 3'-phosphodiesterase
MPDDAAAALDRALAPYRRRFGAARWLTPDKLHATLVFIGGVEEARVPEIPPVIETVAATSDPFPVRTGRGGGRVRGHDGVAWLSLPIGGHVVATLGAQIMRDLPGDLTDPQQPPRRAAGAHVTVARRADDALVDALQAEQLGGLEIGWTADRICLFRSHTGPGGSVYERLTEVDLG